MRYAELSRKLRKLGVRKLEEKRRHEVWGRVVEGTERTTTVPRHCDQEVPAGTLHAILRDLGIDRQGFDKT